MENLPAFGAAIAASALVVAHGIVGHFWSTMQLRDMRLQETVIVGDDAIAHRMFAVVWHIVTCTFAASAVVLYLTAFGGVASTALMRFISIMFASYALVAGALCASRVDAFSRLIPGTAALCMLAVVVLSWVAA